MPELTRIEAFNVELWPIGIHVHHVLGTFPVAKNQITNTMDWCFLEKVIDPGTAPPKQAIDRPFAMLLPLKMYGNVYIVKLREIMQKESIRFPRTEVRAAI
jgi:hypothetical protein